MLLCTLLFAQDRAPEAENRENTADSATQKPHLDSFIEEINDLIQGYDLRLFSGNQLFVLATALSESVFFNEDISVSPDLSIPDRPLLSQLTIDGTRIALTQDLSLEEPEVFLIQRMEAIMPSLPPTLQYQEVTSFSFFTVKVHVLYLHRSSLFDLHSVRIEVFASESEQAGRRPVSPPGSPLLLWGKEAEAPNPPEAYILLRLLFDQDEKLTEAFQYRYDALGRFYELQQTFPENSNRFVALNEEDRGFRELLFAEDWAIVSLRRFDDQGRLRYSSISADSSDEQSSTRIQYLDDGGREETERFPAGGEEQRRYDAESKLLSSTRSFSDGRTELRRFTYTTEGEILREEYQGTLGSIITEYRYEGEYLVGVETTRDGIISRRLEIDGDESVETRYVRGEAVLRIYLSEGIRVAEEELFDGDVLRRREYYEDEE